MSVLYEGTVDALHLRVFENRAETGAQAAKDGAAYLKELLSAGRTEANVIFAAAPSQNEVLEGLLKEGLDFTRIRAFHMDEYIGLPETHPASFRHFLKTALFDRVPFREVFLLDGNAGECAKECERYTALLNSHPPDVCFLGIGENAHIAFNDPGVARFDDKERVKAVTLDETCRMQQVHDGCFASLEEVPLQALTLTVPALLSAKKLICTVPSKTKAHAVKRMLTEEITEDIPASVLRRCEDASLYLDADAAEEYLNTQGVQ